MIYILDKTSSNCICAFIFPTFLLYYARFYDLFTGKMTGYLLKILAVLGISNFVIYIYYFLVPGHKGSYDGFLVYIVTMLILYFIYRMFILYFTRKPELVTFKVPTLLYMFLVHLFVLCCLFFHFSGDTFQSGIILFITILMYSVVPILIFLISFGIGDRILQNIHHHKKESDIFQFLSGLGVGFFSFVSFLVIAGILGIYNIYTVLLLSIIGLIIGYKSIGKILKKIWNCECSFDNDPKNVNFLYITSSEFLFFVLTLLISSNLISIVRPVPIGWDDLGVYMNYPNLMAQAESILSLGTMYAWQVYTGIGYMTGSATQAFFLNSIGGSLSFLVLYLMFRDLFDGVKKTFINIPLLLVTSIVAIPMVSFQLAKDMKLDLGLLFVSSIALYMLYYIVLRMGKDEKHTKQKHKYLLVIGVLIGFAFTIKVTTLLLLSGLLGVLLYHSGGTKAFLGYIAIYIAIFTKFGLWGHMNISYPSTSDLFINSVSGISFLLGFGFLAWAFSQLKVEKFQQLIQALALVMLGFLIAATPWFVKNISEAGQDIRIGTILGGKTDTFVPDLGLVHSEKELEDRRIAASRSMSSSGTTENEDFGRYFGYENGINNYLKLPLNLTMQVNQKGEFTDIGFLFLAMLPTVFLFLPYRRKEYVYITGFVTFFGFLAFFFPPTAIYMTSLMGKIILPFGYLVILGVFLLWLLLNHIVDHKKKLMHLFQLNLIFALFYTFLWTLSSFGIVWYGIVMYASFLLMIGIGLYYVSSYKESDSKKELQIKLFGSGILFIIFSFYFLYSAIPHALRDIKGASYVQFKKNEISADEALFAYQNGYLEALYEMNIDPSKRELFFKDSIESKNLLGIITRQDNTGILAVINAFKKISNDNKFSLQDRQSAKDAIKSMYANVLTPEEAYINTKNVYRIGTFLNYYISRNNSRVSTDSLLFTYSDYLYDTDQQKTLDNIKKVGLEYMLVDLNAATIDKDERKNLTKRYERMLQLFTADGIDLVTTDSMCLRYAIAEYKTSQKDEKAQQEFMNTAGVNYESFNAQGEVVMRHKKLAGCHKKISNMIAEKGLELRSSDYAFLFPLANYLSSEQGKNIAVDEKQRMLFFATYVPSGRFTLFKIK